jgi:predicted transcriptional regulator of viral defense system
MLVIMMLLTFTEAKERCGSQYRLERAVASGQMHRLDSGLYSARPHVGHFEAIAKRYPYAIITSDTAFYIHGMTDVIPDKTYLATRRNATRIGDPAIVQVFMTDALFEPGKMSLEYDGATVSIYSRERMLVELLRKSKSMPFDYYKELVASYRKIAEELDFGMVEEFAMLYKRNGHILDALQKEVL